MVPECRFDVVIFGPPGSGKSTIANRLATALGAEHFDAGARLRSLAASAHPEAARLRELMKAGALVPVEFTVGILEQLLNTKPHVHYVIEGTPRSLEQLAEFDRVMKAHHRTVVPVLLEVSEHTSLARQRIRSTTCAECGAAVADDHCRDCGTRVTGRPDSDEALMLRRLLTYQTTTMAVVKHYESGSLITVNAEREVEPIVSELVDACTAFSQRSTGMVPP